MQFNEFLNTCFDKKKSRTDVPSTRSQLQAADYKECKFCNKKHLWGKERCSAFGKTCTRCGIKNHIAEACRSQDYSKLSKSRSLPMITSDYLSVKDNTRQPYTKLALRKKCSGKESDEKVGMAQDFQESKTYGNIHSNWYSSDSESYRENTLAELTSDKSTDDENNITVRQTLPLRETENEFENESKFTNLNKNKCYEKYSEKIDWIQMAVEMKSESDEDEQFLKDQILHAKRGMNPEEVLIFQEKIDDMIRIENENRKSRDNINMQAKNEMVENKKLIGAHGKCGVCGRDSTLSCCKCKKIYYCCKEHQTEDWNNHKQICRKISKAEEKERLSRREEM